jgi:hypothetical protein
MTLPDDTYKATIDRVEEGIAVILIEDNTGSDDGDEDGHSRNVIDEVHCPAAELPESARELLGVVTVTLADGEVVEIEHHPKKTQQRRADLQDRFDQLAERPPDSNDES